uniref:(northern house mosquito) hypothetical protein n=1 Tax=Culex pipiens TaxID=7175 RepID=A0A8D8KI41_CULPI
MATIVTFPGTQTTSPSLGSRWSNSFRLRNSDNLSQAQQSLRHRCIFRHLLQTRWIRTRKTPAGCDQRRGKDLFFLVRRTTPAVPRHTLSRVRSASSVSQQELKINSTQSRPLRYQQAIIIYLPVTEQ